MQVTRTIIRRRTQYHPQIVNRTLLVRVNPKRVKNARPGVARFGSRPDGAPELWHHESPTYGAREGSAYNGHFTCTCYHPLFVFNQLGDVERCALRPGNVHSADGWRAVLEPVVARYRTVKRRYFRGDAAFANPEIYEFLEAECYGYVIRLPTNNVLQGKIGYLLSRPVGRPPLEVRRYYASFSYPAQSWKKPRRVVAKVERHPGELCPRVGFIVTNWRGRLSASWPSTTIAARRSSGSKRARARSSGRGCRAVPCSEVRPQLHVLAYNLGNFCERWLCPRRRNRGR